MQTKKQDIRVFIEGVWCPVRYYQRNAFIAFQNLNTSYKNLFEYDNGLDGDEQIKFSIERGKRNQCWMIRKNGTKSPIADLSDVQVCGPSGKAIWFDATDYQKWAYFDFIYYKSKDSTNLLEDVEHTEIPIDNLSPGIVFKMSITFGGDVYFRNINACGKDILISDNGWLRKFMCV